MNLSVDERIRALSVCPVFSGVPSDNLGLLAEMMETERLKAGELLLELGESSDRIYVVAGGRLSVIVPGNPEPVRTLNPGELFGEYGMFSGQVRTASIEADSEAVLLSLDYQRFRAFLLQFPESMLVLLKMTVERLVELESRDSDE